MQSGLHESPQSVRSIPVLTDNLLWDCTVYLEVVPTTSDISDDQIRPPKQLSSDCSLGQLYTAWVWSVEDTKPEHMVLNQQIEVQNSLAFKPASPNMDG